MKYILSSINRINLSNLQKNNFIKPGLFFLILSFLITNTYAQTGLNFQGVARTSNNVILASQDITIKLSILKTNATGAAEYTEIRKVTTNAQGLFTAVIGDTGAISTLGNFNNINWKLSPKFLKIEMDPAAGINFITMGTTQFQYVAYAQFAKSVDAENIVGILPVSKGGTGLSSNAALKSALSLDKINNTADADKPISTKTQTALDLIAVTASDTTRFFKRINSKADTADVSAITTTLGSKLNAADTIKYTKQAYSDSSLLSKMKIVDTSAMLSSRIARDTLNLSNRINSKANTTDLSLGLELKESISNKSTAIDLGGTSSSDVLFPTQKAVKEYVAANNAGGGVADGGITNIKLADGTVTYAKFQSIPTNTILGNTSSSTTSVQAIATTGSDNVVLSTSPTITSPILITPHIGIATADSLNHVSIGGLKDKFTNKISLFIRGDAQVSGDNRGDDAINNRYEAIGTNGVDLSSAQNITGAKSFSSNILMSNLAIVGTNSPTTINFANGSQIGDIQNLSFGNPDAAGSIDLFAPYGAKRVQMNYGDSNYMRLSQDSASIGIGNMHWEFNKDGTTDLPLSLAVTGNILIGKGYLNYHGDSFFDTARILSPTNVQIGVIVDPTDPYAESFKWKFNKDGSTRVPGDLNFNNVNGSEIKSDESIYITSKNLLKLRYSDGDTTHGGKWIHYTRLDLDKDEAALSVRDEDLNISNDWYYKVDGSSWFPGDLQVGKIADGGTKPSTINFNNGSEIGDIQNINNDDPDDAGSIDLFAPNGAWWVQMNYGNKNYFALHSDHASLWIGDSEWHFSEDGTTTLPGGLKLGNTLFPYVSGNDNDVLTIDGNTGNAIWKAPISSDLPILINEGAANYGLTINSESTNLWGSGIGFKSSVDNPTPNKGLFQLDAAGNMVFRTWQNVMYFDNFDSTGSMSFRIGDEYIGYKKGMNLDKHGNLQVDGTLSSAGIDLTSDIRLKKNITPLKNSLSIIQKLNPVSYNKKKSIYGDDYSIKENGFIAQELQKILPDLVHESVDKDRVLSVNYTAIIPILTKGMQEQQAIIEDQKKRLETLEKLVNDLIQKK
jgi:Chaperone of endosialidase